MDVALCMVPLIHVVMIIGGRTFHPCWICDVCSMLYLSSFLVMAAWGNLSLQYENLRIVLSCRGGV